ncbi:hypothetical protein [Acinetobacter beijerinckii]|uniref:hypothetical protein n=1 Tax=Acinetobacter beijerinckii TaxID=262668 RepID=UPI0003A866A5|nr:hypothetical protein [Acinetobacter beijerinckii]
MFNKAFSSAVIAQSGHGLELGLVGSLTQDRTVRTEHGLCVCWHIKAALSA